MGRMLGHACSLVGRLSNLCVEERSPLAAREPLFHSNAEGRDETRRRVGGGDGKLRMLTGWDGTDRNRRKTEGKGDEQSIGFFNENDNRSRRRLG